MKILRFLLLIRFGISELSSWLALFITLLVTLDVLLRYFSGRSIPASVEFTQVLLVIMIFLALGKSQENKQHIRVEFLIDRLPIFLKKYWEAIVHLFAFVYISIIFWESIELFTTSFATNEHYSGAVRVPMYPARGAILIGCGLMMIELVKDIVFLVTKKLNYPLRHPPS